VGTLSHVNQDSFDLDRFECLVYLGWHWASYCDVVGPAIAGDVDCREA